MCFLTRRSEARRELFYDQLEPKPLVEDLRCRRKRTSAIRIPSGLRAACRWQLANKKTFTRSISSSTMRKVSLLQPRTQSHVLNLVLLCLTVIQPKELRVLLVEGASTGVPIQVNDENVEAALMGRKATFMMFYGSLCDDCEDMTPEWNRLAEEWHGHDVGQIAQVDCDSEGAEGICDYFQIQDIPTIVVGGSMEWDFYQGAHDYESLSEFAKRAISKPICTARIPEHCDPAELKVIQSLASKSTEELEEIFERAQGQMRLRHEVFQAEEALVMEKQKLLANEFHALLDEAAGDYDYKLLMQIMQQRARTADTTRSADKATQEGQTTWGVPK